MAPPLQAGCEDCGGHARVGSEMAERNVLVSTLFPLEQGMLNFFCKVPDSKYAGHPWSLSHMLLLNNPLKLSKPFLACSLWAGFGLWAEVCQHLLFHHQLSVFSVNQYMMSYLYKVKILEVSF